MHPGEAMLNSWNHTSESMAQFSPQPSLLAMIWAAWFGAQPAAAQQALFYRTRDLTFEDRASRVTAEPVLLLTELQRNAAASPEVRAIAHGLLRDTLLLHVPPTLAAVVDASDTQRASWAVDVRAAARYSMTTAQTEAAALVIAWLVGMELVGDGSGVRLIPESGPYIGAVLSDLRLPAGSLRAQLQGLARGW
jgi:hypothetical protein